MEFAYTDRCNDYRERLLAFMDECIYPNEAVYEEQLKASGDPHHQPAIEAKPRRERLYCAGIAGHGAEGLNRNRRHVAISGCAGRLDRDLARRIGGGHRFRPKQTNEIRRRRAADPEVRADVQGGVDLSCPGNPQRSCRAIDVERHVGPLVLRLHSQIALERRLSQPHRPYRI